MTRAEAMKQQGIIDFIYEFESAFRELPDIMKRIAGHVDKNEEAIVSLFFGYEASKSVWLFVLSFLDSFKEENENRLFVCEENDKLIFSCKETPDRGKILSDTLSCKNAEAACKMMRLFLGNCIVK